MSLDMSTVTGIQIPITTTTYRELEYIRLATWATGNNYIDTGVKFVQGKYRAITITLPSAGNTLGRILGFNPSTWYDFGIDGYLSVGGGRSYPVYVKMRNSSTNQEYLLTTRGAIADLGRVRLSLTTRYTNTFGNEYFAEAEQVSTGEIFATTESWISYSGDISTSYNILIGAAGVSGTDTTQASNGVLVHRYQVKTGSSVGNLENDFIPCQRKSDGVCGMYDRITNTFYELKGYQSTSQYNSTAGPVVNELPAWSPGGTLYYEVTQIDDYVNGIRRQIWPCYSEGPSNPDAPVVGNAFDYDDTITWTVGTGVENSDGYYYYPITATGQANGIQIALADNPNGWPSDGKPTTSTTYTWKVTAERAGLYQMIMSAKMSSAQHATTGYWSTANIQVNSSTTDILKLNLYGDTPDFDAVDYNDVVVAIVPLTGYVDSVTFQQSSYRLVVDPTSNIIFREIAATSPAYITLDTSNVTTTFDVGDTFSYSGLVVSQTLVNGTSNTISSGYTVSSPDMTTPGTKTITVTYGDFTASYNITVNAVLSWVTTATLTNTDSQTFEQGTYNGTIDGVRIPVVNYSSGGYSGGRVSSTSTDEVYKITPPSAGDYMLILKIKRGSGDPQFYINGVSIGAISGVLSDDYYYYEITYPVTLTSGENTLTFRNNSYRCYFDMNDYVYLLKTSTNPMS